MGIINEVEFGGAGKILDFSNADVAVDQYHLYPVSPFILCLTPFNGSFFFFFNVDVGQLFDFCWVPG